jgi:hypothetical protein
MISMKELYTCVQIYLCTNDLDEGTVFCCVDPEICCDELDLIREVIADAG